MCVWQFVLESMLEQVTAGEGRGLEDNNNTSLRPN